MSVTELLVPDIKVKYMQSLGLPLQKGLKKDDKKTWLLISYV